MSLTRAHAERIVGAAKAIFVTHTLLLPPAARVLQRTDALHRKALRATPSADISLAQVRIRNAAVHALHSSQLRHCFVYFSDESMLSKRFFQR